MAGNNQMQGWNQPIKNNKNGTKNQKTESWFFEKIKNIDKSSAKLAKGHRDSIQINKIRNEKGYIKETK